jgi:hypothetical protein
MRAAPLVSYPLGQARFRAVLVACLLLLTLGLMVAVDLAQPTHRLTVIMGCGLLLPVGLLLRARSSSGDVLQWDGQHWHLQGPNPTCGQLHLVLDLQRALLLRWSSPLSGSDPVSTWLWIEQNADPVIWMDVRRAIYWNAH